MKLDKSKGNYNPIHNENKYDVVVDTSNMNPEECAASILKFIEKNE